MMFIFEKQIINAIKGKLNIDITKPEYSKTIFSVDSIEIKDPVNLPYDKTYKGDILIFKNDKPIYALDYIIESHENIPEQSVCFVSIDEFTQDSLTMNDE